MTKKEQDIVNNIQQIWEQIRDNEDISYGECAYLQEHKDMVKKHFPTEPQLWEWAGIPETEWAEHSKELEIGE